MDWTFLLNFGIGAIIKHVIPSKKINKFIPVINLVGTTAVVGLATNDWQGAIQVGVNNTLMSTGLHSATRSTVLPNVRINGQGI